MLSYVANSLHCHHFHQCQYQIYHHHPNSNFHRIDDLIETVDGNSDIQVASEGFWSHFFQELGQACQMNCCGEKERVRCSIYPKQISQLGI